MSKRYNKVERLGLTKADLILTDEIGWIFRRHSDVDVGVDAMIEIVEEEPMGKFIGVQMKSGDKIPYVGTESLTIYISQIHATYWLGMNVPMVLMLYYPKTKSVYWREVCNQTIEKTTTRWKIQIPFSNKLSAESSTELIEIVNRDSQKSTFNDTKALFLSSVSISDALEDLSLFKEAIAGIGRIKTIIHEFEGSINATMSRLHEIQTLGQLSKMEQASSLMNSFAKVMALTSQRICSERDVFSSCFAASWIAFRKVMNFYHESTNDNNLVESLLPALVPFPTAFDEAIDGLQSLMNIVNRYSSKHHDLMRVSSLYLSASLESIMDELKVAKVMSFNTLMHAKSLIGDEE